MSIIFTPTNNESADESNKKAVAKNVAIHTLTMINQRQSNSEVHQNRMKELRKELEYLKETEWKYEPIEKYIGQ